MRFRFRAGLFVTTLAALAILLSLGAWQMQRLSWKRDLIAATQARLAAEPIPFAEAAARAAAGEKMEYQPVYLNGVYAHNLESHVFGTLKGVPGVYVFTPFEIAASGGGKKFILVNRGFVPQKLKAGDARADGQTEGEAVVEGLFRSAEVKRGFEKALAPKDQLADNLYFARDPSRLAARHRLAVPQYYVDSFGRENAARWPQGGVTRVEFPNRHLEYALTWFGLAAALIGVFLAFSFKR